MYFVVKLIRYAAGENVKFERFVPLISAGLGVVFGVICYYAIPACIPAENVVVAIVIGAASGFTAIGTDQMLKQFGKKTAQSSFEKDKTEKKEENEDNAAEQEQNKNKKG